MKRLPLPTFLERNIIGRRAIRRGRFKVTRVQDDPGVQAITGQVLLNYRAQYGVRIAVPQGAVHEGDKRVVKMFLRDMYAGMFEELLDLREYAWEQGLDDIAEWAERLLTLIDGGEVPDEQPSAPDFP